MWLLGIFIIFSSITRNRTCSRTQGDVISGYVSSLSPHCCLQNNLVDFLQVHMALNLQPLISLVSWFLPHLQERQNVDSLIPIRMWGGFLQHSVMHCLLRFSVLCTESVHLAFIMPCINVILQSAFHKNVKSIITQRKTQWKQPQIFLNRPHRRFFPFFFLQ